MTRILFFLFIFINILLPAKEKNIFLNAFEIANKKTVKIFGGKLGSEHGYASGIVVSKDGLILTSLGMFLGSDKLRVTLYNGETYSAEILKRDRDLQSALLKIDYECEHYFDLNIDPEVYQGDWVLAVANPFKVADSTEKHSLNLGVLSLRSKLEVKRKSQDVEFRSDVFIIDAITSNPGSQGGALVNLKGELIGMIGKILEDKGTNTKINYAIPIDVLKPFANRNETVANNKGSLYTGIHLFMVNGPKAPAFIDRLDIGSPASLVGLKKDDLIISVGPTLIKNCETFHKTIKDLEQNEKVVMVIRRGEQFIKVELNPIKSIKIESKDSEEDIREIDLELD